MESLDNMLNQHMCQFYNLILLLMGVPPPLCLQLCVCFVLWLQVGTVTDLSRWFIECGGYGLLLSVFGSNVVVVDRQLWPTAVAGVGTNVASIEVLQCRQHLLLYGFNLHGWRVLVLCRSATANNIEIRMMTKSVSSIT